MIDGRFFAARSTPEQPDSSPLPQNINVGESWWPMLRALCWRALVYTVILYAASPANAAKDNVVSAASALLLVQRSLFVLIMAIKLFALWFWRRWRAGQREPVPDDPELTFYPVLWVIDTLFLFTLADALLQRYGDGLLHLARAYPQESMVIALSLFPSIGTALLALLLLPRRRSRATLLLSPSSAKMEKTHDPSTI